MDMVSMIIASIESLIGLAAMIYVIPQQIKELPANRRLSGIPAALVAINVPIVVTIIITSSIRICRSLGTCGVDDYRVIGTLSAGTTILLMGISFMIIYDKVPWIKRSH